MKKLLSLLILLPFFGLSQTTGFFRYDTVRFQKVGASSEFILENATKGNTNAFLQNYSQGRTRFAYALDSVWLDGDSIRFRYGSTTIAVHLGGSTSIDTTSLSNRINLKVNISDTAAMLAPYLYNANEGLSVSGKYAQFGGILTSPASLLTNRRIDLNGKALYFTRGLVGTDTTAFDTRYTPFVVDLLDSLTVDEPFSADYAALPKHGGLFKRTIRYYPPAYKSTNRGGFKFILQHEAGDSAVIRTDGGDYQYPLMGETRLKPLPGHTGQTVFRISQATGGQLRLNEGVPAVVANMFIDSTSASSYVRVNGALTGFRSYLVAANSGAPDTINNVAHISASSFVNSPSWVKKQYFLAPDVYWNRTDSAFLLFDTARNASSGKAVRAFWRAKTRIGATNDWTSPYQFAVGGSSLFEDSIVHGQRLAVTDTTGVDIMVRDRSTGILKYITADNLGVGGGGSLTLQQIFDLEDAKAVINKADTIYGASGGNEVYSIINPAGTIRQEVKVPTQAATLFELTPTGMSWWARDSINDYTNEIFLDPINTIFTNPLGSYEFNNIQDSIADDVNHMLVWNDGDRRLYKAPLPTGSGGTTVSLAKGFTADTMTVASAKTIIPRYLWNETFAGGNNVTSGSPFMMELVSGTAADAHIAPNAYQIVGATGYGYGVVESGTTTTGKAVLQSAYNVTNQNFLGKIDNDYYYRVSYKNVIFDDLSDGTETYKATIGFAVDNAVTSSVIVTYTQSENSGAFVCTSHVSNTPENTNTAVTVAADTEYDIDIEIYNQVCKFWINGTLVATHSTSVPAVGAAVYGPMLRIVKSAGATNRKIFVDDITPRIDHENDL